MRIWAARVPGWSKPAIQQPPPDPDLRFPFWYHLSASATGRQITHLASLVLDHDHVGDKYRRVALVAPRNVFVSAASADAITDRQNGMDGEGRGGAGLR